ncbi:MAG: DUF2500 domain-containing protein [Clostridia bacterium]|nr:DUF2500 domain-containing protein [Clostridia bacterium]
MNSGFGMGGMHDFMFDVFPVIFSIMFVIILGVFVVTALSGVRQWHTNNNSPRLTVHAAVVAKRTQVGHHHHGTHEHRHSHTYTHYFVTFEVESGDRMEFEVSGQESGLLVEGDRGTLTFQGTRYQGFAREG